MKPAPSSFRVTVGNSPESNGVYCKECGVKVVGAQDWVTVRLNEKEELLALPFPCLSHRCRPASP